MKGEILLYIFPQYKILIVIVMKVNLISFVSILSILIFVSISCNNQIPKKESDLKKLELKGDVLVLKEYSFIAEEKFGEIVIGKPKWEDYWGRDKQMDFNNSGFLIKKVEYNWPISQFNMLGEFSETYKDMISTYKYDSVGNLEEVLMIYEDSSFYCKYVYHYDKYGKLTKLNWFKDEYLEKSMNQDIYNYYYNEDDLVILEEKVSPRRDRINLTINMYDDLGQKIRDETYYFNMDCHLGEWEYKYDELGNLVEENQMTGWYIESKTTFKYDNLQNPIEKIKYDSDGKIETKSTYKYEYDEIGNWIKRIDFIDDTPSFILTREITYK